MPAVFSGHLTPPPPLADSSHVQWGLSQDWSVATVAIVAAVTSLYIVVQMCRALGHSRLRTRTQHPPTASDRYLSQWQAAERQAQHLATRLGMLTQTLPIGVFEANLAGRCQYLTPMCAEILGVTFLDAFVGSWFDHVHADDRVELGERWSDAWQRQEPFAAECRVIASHGGKRWVQVRATPLVTDDGLIYLGTVEDITEQRQRAREVNCYVESLDRLRRIEHSKNRQLEESIAAAEQAQQEMARLCQTRSEFLANMSHEIRTPMTAILGFTELLIDEGADRLPSDSPLLTIRRNGEYLLELLNDILDLSKIEAGRMEVEFVPTNPRQIVQDVIDLMDVRLRGRDVALRVEVHEPFPRSVECDPTRLKQILLNLVGNAVKFTERGSIAIRLALLEPTHGRSLAPESSLLQLEVVDTGIGMTADQISKLFRPFRQAELATARQFGGTGLGLSICKSFAEKLRGDIQVTSEPGVGSTFRVILPVANVSDASSEPLPAMSNEARNGHTEAPRRLPEGTRLLIAEDGADNRRLLKFLLTKAGADITLAENGQEALMIALDAWRNDSPFDVILMDIQMPVLDGYQATQQLRSAGYTHPILALTAHSMSGDREKCLAAGCDDYAQKPIQRVRLLDQLCQLIARTPETQHADA